MSKLSSKLKDHLDLHLRPGKKALSYILDNDWSKISKVKAREDEYKIQNLLNNKNLSALEKLCKLAVDDLSHPTIKKQGRLGINKLVSMSSETLRDLQQIQLV